MRFELAMGKMLVSLALGVEHLLRASEKSWPESGRGNSLADSLKATRTEFAEALGEIVREGRK